MLQQDGGGGRGVGRERGLALSLPLSGGCGGREGGMYGSSPTGAPLALFLKGATRRSPRGARGPDLGTSSQSSSDNGLRHSDTGALAEETFLLHGKQYKVSLDNQGINLMEGDARTLCRPPSSALYVAPGHVPFQEIIQVGMADSQRGTCFPVQKNFEYKRMSFLIIHTFRRGWRNPNDWQPLELVLEHHAEEVVGLWSSTINKRIQSLTKGMRPRRLHVWINPYGGHKRGLQIWNSVCVPIFESAGVKVRKTVTKEAGQARADVEALSAEDLESLDGLVAVGGDGLFGEILNGLLHLRSKGGPRGAAAARLRLGQIPAGSTDAVAWSINGSRKPMAAALHIVLGDRAAMDCQRIDVAGRPPLYSCCLASAGFLGEVLHASEKMRWAGPARYDIAGLYAFLKLGTYSIRVRYLPSRGTGDGIISGKNHHAALPCLSGCEVCRQAIGLHSGEVSGGEDAGGQHLAWMRGGAEALEANLSEVKCIEGRYKGLMCVVSPCRSDKSVHGVAPTLHLADGKMWLILIRDCNHVQYLRFLVMLTTSGLIPGQMSFVDVVECEAVSIEPLNGGCKWNVDGESLPQEAATARVHRGLVEVFGRGVEKHVA